MKTITRPLPSLFILFGFLSQTVFVPLQADLLVEYTFAGGATTPTTADPNMVETHETAWVGLTSSGFSGSSNTAYIFANTTPTTGGDFSYTKYLEFTAAAESGYNLNLNSLSIQLGGDNNSSTLDYTVDAALRSDAEVTDYTTDIPLTPGPGTVASHTIPTQTVRNHDSFTFDLSGSDYQNISSLTLRIYPKDDSNNSSNIFRIDEISLIGSVTAIPEPGSLILLSLGFAGWFVLRRTGRRNRA